MQRILLLDNYDSFTYNLEHYLSSQEVKVDVVRNDELNGVDAICDKYDKMVISPGPGLPREAKGMMELIKMVHGKIPVLGVCLGMQAIAEFLGGELYNQKEVKHGVEETITIVESPLFEGLQSEINVGLYHSWSVLEGKGDFEITARTKNGVIMAIQNLASKMHGVQFHPESVMTPDGMQIIQNFLNLK